MTLAATAIISPTPTVDDLYVVTVGTTATTAVDLFAKFGITSPTARSRITIRANAEVYAVFGAAGVVTPAAATAGDPGATGLCRRIPADGEASMTLRAAFRYVRFVAAAAGTRVEVQVEAG